MFKFIHTADIHLDSPLKGLARYEGAPVDAIRQATRRALENLVQLAIEEEVAFVLIAGDLYDGDWRDFQTGLFFSSQMSRLRSAEISVYVVSGNHDAASRITRSLAMPDNVHVFPTDRCGTVELANVGAAIRAVRPYAVDVSSGVESASGEKDPDRIQAFCDAVRAADLDAA